jgi:hypothetical protein
VGRRLAGLVLAALCLATPACAHHRSSAAALKAGAIAIPALTHGQMAVIARHRGEIVDLAEAQVPTDETMRRLLAHAKLQRFACWFGLMPGSIADEASPFNECAHAYLAATRALLLHLRRMPGDASAANALAEAIELEMLRDSISLAMCAYSEEPFDTGEIIGPRWVAIPKHPPTLAVFGAAGLALAGCIGVAARRRRHRRAAPAWRPADAIAE